MAISPMVERFAHQAVLKNRLTYPLLPDKANAVAKRFGIVFTLPDYLKTIYLGFGTDLNRFNGDDSWTLPMLARYVVDREGIIRAANVNPDYTVRPKPKKTIADFKALSGDKYGGIHGQQVQDSHYIESIDYWLIGICERCRMIQSDKITGGRGLCYVFLRIQYLLARHIISVVRHSN